MAQRAFSLRYYFDSSFTFNASTARTLDAEPSLAATEP
jgi:hypothetical protein